MAGPMNPQPDRVERHQRLLLGDLYQPGGADVGPERSRPGPVPAAFIRQQHIRDLPRLDKHSPRPVGLTPFPQTARCRIMRPSRGSGGRLLQSRPRAAAGVAASRSPVLRREWSITTS